MIGKARYKRVSAKKVAMDVVKPEEQPEYEFIPEEYESPGMRRTQEELTLRAIELLDMPGGDGEILDVGCGTGFSTEILKEEGYNVVGVDRAKKMVAKAKERGVDALVADMHTLPFPNGSFDAIVSISTIQWSQDYRVLAREFRRVLKAKGKVVAQFYPKNSADAMKMAKAFTAMGFEGGMQIDNPSSIRKKKHFLVMQRK